MKKIYSTLALWHYRRMLRKYYLHYLREGETSYNAMRGAIYVVYWLIEMANIKSFSELKAFVSQDV